MFSFEPDVVLYVAYTDKGFTTWHLAEMSSAGVDIPYDDIREMMKEAGVDDDAKNFKRYGSARNLYTFHIDNAKL